MEGCYITLERVDDNFETVKNYAQIYAEFCKRNENKFWANYTVCLNYIRQTDRPIKEVTEFKLLTRNEDDSVYTREKRGVFNFIGGIIFYLEHWIMKMLITTLIIFHIWKMSS